MSAANTGPKAVLADATCVQLLAAERDRQSATAMHEMATTFGRGMTVSEEEDARRTGQERETEVTEWRAKRMEELRSQVVDDSSDNNSDDPEGWESKVRRRRRGAVRQVDAQGLLASIERPGWALLFIYEPDVPRCETAIKELLALARKYPTDAGNGGRPMWLKARATALSFSLLPSANALPTLDEHDTDESDHHPGQEEESRADTDVLPTLLAYRDGELVHTWIRVDWCAPEGMEALLRSSGILLSGDGERNV